METYTALRAFADSWHLLFMFLFFIGMVLFVFRPGSSKVHDETANMIFRNDDRPDHDGNKDADAPAGHGQSNEAR